MLQVKINYDNIRQNLQNVKKLIGDKKLYFVVKANAYGHCMVECARQCVGCYDALFVACVEEGISLRKAGITAEILVGGVAPCGVLCEKYNLTATINSVDDVVRLSEKNRKIKVQIAIDSGMNRYGTKEQVLQILQTLSKNFANGLELLGIYSHLAAADCPTVALQSANFDNAKNIVEGFLGRKIHSHIGATSALALPDLHYDGVRVGLGAYGYGADFALPAMHVTCQIQQIKNLKMGEGVGYNHAFVAPRDMQIAVCSGGYADGVLNAFSGFGGIVGRVCMDCHFRVLDCLNCLDCGGKKVGDSLPLFDSLQDLADYCGLLPYEILCGVRGGRGVGNEK